MNNRRFSRLSLFLIFSIFFNFVHLSAQNPCGFNICDPLDIKQHFEDAGFGQINIEIGEEIITLLNNQNDEKKSSSSEGITEDHAKNFIKINDQFVRLDEIMNDYAITEVALEGLDNTLALITDNDYFCECHVETCDIINDKFTSSDNDAAYWFHIWRSDPLDTQGILFYGGNMGFDGGKFTPSSIEHQTAINDQIDDILADINTYSYSNKESHLISSLSFSLLDVWEMYSETDPPEGPVAQNVELDCDGFTSGQHTYLSPAGVAMVFPENIRPGFDKKDEWKAKGPIYAYRELATNQLVCGWYLPSSDLSFQGYRNRTTNKDIEYDAWPVGSLNVPARLGSFDEYQASNGDNCTTFSLYDIEYTPNISNTTGSGFYIGDVDEQGTVIYTSPFYQDFTYCINTLSFNGTESYLSFTGSDEDPVSPTLNPVGLQMIVDHPDLGNIHVYIRHEYGLGDMDPVPDYIYWDNQVCAWRGLPVGYEMPPDVFWAILQVMYEVSTGHGVWDAAAAVPVIGAPIDVANAIWYSLEGDATNATLAIAGLAIDIKIVKEGLQYVIKIGGDVIIALAKRFGDEVVGYYPEGIKLSEMLKVLSDKYPDDDVSEIGQDMLNFVLNKLPDDVIQKFNDIPALANVWDEARKLNIADDDKVELFIDLVDYPGLLNEFLLNVNLVNSWKGLRNTGLRTDLTWLNRADSWITEGAEFSVDGSGKLSKGGVQILEIKNQKILPDIYDYPVSSGTPVGEVANGYQLIKNGEDLSVRRVPETSGYTQTDLDLLTQHHNAHVLERHGHDVTDDSLIKRANTGIAPDGKSGNIPSHSSKFESESTVKIGLDNTLPGTDAFINGVQSGNRRIVTYTSAVDVGRGVPAGGNTFVSTKKVKAIYEDVNGSGDYQLLTMYPDFSI